MPGHYVIYWLDGTCTSLKGKNFVDVMKEACRVEGIKYDRDEILKKINRIVFLP